MQSALGILTTLASSEAPARLSDRLLIATDPRVELLSILQLLSGAEPYRRAAPSDYTRAVAERFSVHVEHRAVELTRSLRGALGIGYDAPMSLAVWLDEESFEARQPLAPRPPGLDARWTAAPLDDYLEAVRAFASDSGFREFFASQRAYRAAVEQRYRAALEGVEPISWFDGFFGPRPSARFQLVPGLLCGPNNYGVRADLADGAEVVWQVLGLGACDAEGLPILGEGLEPLLVHELAHSYVNPALEDAREALRAPFERAFDLDPEVFERQAYGNWFTTACESVVRATTVLYLAEVHGESRCVSQLGDEETRGFRWTEALVEALEGFRAAREGGPEREAPSLTAYAPVLAAALERWIEEGGPERELAFRGPINAVFRWKQAGRMEVIAPRQVEGDETREWTRANLARFHAKLYAPAGVPLREPVSAAEEPDPGVARVVYGTPGADPAIAALFRRAGWSASEASLKLGKREFAFEDWVLIAAFPGGRGAPVLLYAAHGSANLDSLNNLRHGTSDWIVGRALGGGRFQPVASGSFPKRRDGTWTLALPAER